MEDITKQRLRGFNERIKILELDKLKYEALLKNGSFFRKKYYTRLVRDCIENIRYAEMGVDDVLKDELGLGNKKEMGFKIE